MAEAVRSSLEVRCTNAQARRRALHAAELPLMSSSQMSKDAQCQCCGHIYLPDAKFCCRCGTERGTDKNDELGSWRGSNEEVRNVVQEQIARHSRVILSSLDELWSQIAGRVQGFQDTLDAELSRARKEDDQCKTLAAQRNGQPMNGSGHPVGHVLQSVELGTFGHVESLEVGVIGSVKVLDMESAEHLAKNEELPGKQLKNDTLTAVSMHSESEVELLGCDLAEKFSPLNSPPSPQNNNLLTGVVPLPKGEAPLMPFQTPAIKLNEEVISVCSDSRQNIERSESSLNFTDDVKDDFKVLEVWTSRKNFKSGYGGKASAQRSSAESRQTSNEFAELVLREQSQHISIEENKIWLEHGHDEPQRRCAKNYVFHPNSVMRAFWDMSSFILVFYDLVFIPLMLLDLPYSMFEVVVAWITRIFWTADLFFSFSTGYSRSDGSIEMDQKKIVIRYLKSWFSIDISIVLADWVEMYWATGSGLGFARIGKASRIFRIIRLVRLLRLIRMRDVIRDFMERMHSERLVILASILKIMLVICGLAHIMACIWYRLGNSDTGRSWIRVELYNGDSLGYKYATSLHWSISQFSGGMDEVRPQNLHERVYAIICFLIAFIMDGVFISSVTSSMTQLFFLSNRKSRQQNVLREFLEQHGISHRLAVQIMRNARHAIHQQQRDMPESSVELLELVSTPLRSRMHFEMYVPTFGVHPFFARFVDTCPHVMRRVCHSATSMLSTSCCDVIFNGGEIAAKPAMYIICAGTFTYVSLNGRKYRLHEDAVLAEAVLWTTWMHQGTLTAETNSHLLVLEALNFQFIVTQFERIDLDPATYAEHFVRDLNQGDRELTDLPKHLQEDAGGVREKLADLNIPNIKRRSTRIFGARHSRCVVQLSSDMNI